MVRKSELRIKHGREVAHTGREGYVREDRGELRLTNINLNVYYTHGRRLWGDWGTVPKKFEVGDGPCIRPPNILRNSVVGCVRKYELSKKKVSSRNFV